MAHNTPALRTKPIALAGCLILASLFIGNAAAAAEQIFVVAGTITSKDRLTVSQVTIEQGSPQFSPTGSEYLMIISSDFNHELYRAFLPVSFTLHTEPTGTRFTLPSLALRLRLPFFFSAKTLVFKHGDTTLLTLDLPRAVCAATVKDGVCLPYCLGWGLDPDCFQCGNGVCDPSETGATCPADCGVGPTASTAAVPAPTSPAAPRTNSSPVYFLAGGLVLVVGIAALFVVRKNTPQA